MEAMLGLLFINLFSTYVWYDIKLLGLPVLVWCALAAGVYYLYAFVLKKRLLPALKMNPYLTFFTVQGLVWLGLSFLGLYGWFPQGCTFPVDLSYAPRQAYYLYFLPLITVPAVLSDGGSLYALLRKYGVLFAVAYLIFVSHNWYYDPLSVPPQNMYILCALCLIGDRRDPLNWVLLLVLWLLPASGSGDTTHLILRLLCTGLFLLGDRSIVQKLSIAVLPCIVVVSLLLPFSGRLVRYVDKESGLSPSIGFRASIWRDEDLATASSFGVGVGFGTTYASDELVGDWWPLELGANDEYSAEERPFVTGPHSTFVAAFFRQGLLGLLALCGLFFSLWRRILHAAEEERRYMLFLLWGAALMIAFNVGFESPMYFQIVLLSLAFLFLRLYGTHTKNAPRAKLPTAR